MHVQSDPAKERIINPYRPFTKNKMLFLSNYSVFCKHSIFFSIYSSNNKLKEMQNTGEAVRNTNQLNEGIRII